MPQHQLYTDEELIALYRQSHDNEWLGVLLQRYTLLLLGVAMKYLKDRSQAEDAVQQIFLKTLTHLPEDPIGNFKGWLYVLMRNHCLQQLRGKVYVAGDEKLQWVSDNNPDSMKEVLEKEQRLDEVEEALEKLNEPQKKCVTMFYMKKQSYQEIMEQTGYSYMEVKSYIQNGKRNLKNLLTGKEKNHD